MNENETHLLEWVAFKYYPERRFFYHLVNIKPKSYTALCGESIKNLESKKDSIFMKGVGRCWFCERKLLHLRSLYGNNTYIIEKENKE